MVKIVGNKFKWAPLLLGMALAAVFMGVGQKSYGFAVLTIKNLTSCTSPVCVVQYYRDNKSGVFSFKLGPNALVSYSSMFWSFSFDFGCGCTADNIETCSSKVWTQQVPWTANNTETYCTFSSGGTVNCIRQQGHSVTPKNWPLDCPDPNKC